MWGWGVWGVVVVWGGGGGGGWGGVGVCVRAGRGGEGWSGDVWGWLGTLKHRRKRKTKPKTNTDRVGTHRLGHSSWMTHRQLFYSGLQSELTALVVHWESEITTSYGESYESHDTRHTLRHYPTPPHKILKTIILDPRYEWPTATATANASRGVFFNLFTHCQGKKKR